MAEPTKGPWKAIQTRDKQGWVIAGMEEGEACDPVVWEMGGIDHEPNARLIAAAPDLLAALEALMDSQRGLNHAQWLAATTAARAAIINAYGLPADTTDQQLRQVRAGTLIYHNGIWEMPRAD